MLTIDRIFSFLNIIKTVFIIFQLLSMYYSTHTIFILNILYIIHKIIVFYMGFAKKLFIQKKLALKGFIKIN